MEKKSKKRAVSSRKITLGIVAVIVAVFMFIPDYIVAQSGTKGPSDNHINIGVGDMSVCSCQESEKNQGKKTRIYTVFTSGIVTGAAYSIYHPDIEIIDNKEVLEILKEKCREVEFTGENTPAKDIIEDIKAQKDKLDGLLCLGSPPAELTSIGLPMVAVFRLWGQWFPLSYHHNDFKGKKVVTACLPVLPDKDRSLYLSRIDDIAGKIKLIEAVSKMRGLRILIITDKPPLGVWEPYDFQIITDKDVAMRSESERVKSGNSEIEMRRKEYERIFVNNLKETFGAYLVPIPQEDLVKKMNVQDEVKAQKVTKKWIEGASGIRGTNEEQILRSAKLYLAMKELLAEHNCQAIATEGYGSFPGGYSIVPSQGLPSSQLCTDGVVAVGETLLNSLITQQLGYNFTGSTGQNGDYFIDFFNDIAITAHCEAPFNPYGDGEKSPYIIRNLPFFEEENTAGAVAQVLYPIGVPATVVKIDMNNKKIAVFTGVTVSGEELFPYWNDLLCRTKVAIKTNAKALHENFDWKTFGHHRVTFFGDYRQEFIDLADLIGFEVVECDN